MDVARIEEDYRQSKIRKEEDTMKRLKVVFSLRELKMLESASEEEFQ